LPGGGTPQSRSARVRDWGGIDQEARCDHGYLRFV
jgi:hypothetical protein